MGTTRLNIAISNIAWTANERFAAYEIMAAYGVSGLEIAPGLFFNAASDPFFPSDIVRERAVTEIKDKGFSIVSMQSLLFGVSGAALFGCQTAHSLFLLGIKNAILLAGQLNVPNLVLGSPNQRSIPQNWSADAACDFAIPVFRELGGYALENGTAIALEPTPASYGTNFLNTLRETFEFVRNVDHPGIALNFDLGAIHMNNEMHWTLSNLAQILPYVNHVHVSSPYLAPAPYDERALRLLYDNFERLGYDKHYSIEMRRANDGVRSVSQSLNALCRVLDRNSWPTA